MRFLRLRGYFLFDFSEGLCVSSAARGVDWHSNRVTSPRLYSYTLAACGRCLLGADSCMPWGQPREREIEREEADATSISWDITAVFQSASPSLLLVDLW